MFAQKIQLLLNHFHIVTFCYFADCLFFAYFSVYKKSGIFQYIEKYFLYTGKYIEKFSTILNYWFTEKNIQNLNILQYIKNSIKCQVCEYIKIDTL